MSGYSDLTKLETSR